MLLNVSTSANETLETFKLVSLMFRLLISLQTRMHTRMLQAAVKRRRRKKKIFVDKTIICSTYLFADHRDNAINNCGWEFCFLSLQTCHQVEHFVISKRNICIQYPSLDITPSCRRKWVLNWQYSQAPSGVVDDNTTKFTCDSLHHIFDKLSVIKFAMSNSRRPRWLKHGSQNLINDRKGWKKQSKHAI